MKKRTSLLIAGTLLAAPFAVFAQAAEAVVAAPETAVPEALAQIDGATVGRWTMDLDAAKKLAAEKKLPILLDFSGSDWCGWCKLMEENVFTKPEWKAYAEENLVMVLLDYPSDKSLVPEKYVARNEALQAEYGIQGFPTFVVLDDDGTTELGRLSAGQDKTPESFIAELKGLFKNRTAEKEKFIASLLPEAQAEYTALNEQLVKTQSERTALEAELEAASAKHNALMEQEAKLQEQLREFRIKQQGDEIFKAYQTLKATFDAKEKELSDWIATGPDRSEENMQKFQAMQSELQQLYAELQAF